MEVTLLQYVVLSIKLTGIAVHRCEEVDWLHAHKCIMMVTRQYSFILDVGLNNRSWEMPCSGTEDISMLTSSSNIGEPGVWIFQVDGTDIIPACPNEGFLHNSVNNTVIFSCICFTFTY